MNLLVMAKSPRPGRVKTRLCPPCTPQEAADLAEAALADTLASACKSRADRVMVALDGPPGPWIPSGVELFAQCRGGLGDRLAAAWARMEGPTLQIGMDTPQVSPDDLDAAFDSLLHSSGGCAIGLAGDGGWWALGMQEPNHRAFRGVSMSSPETGLQQIEALRREVGPPSFLAAMDDFDTAVDALAVASQAPETNFASELARIGLPTRLGHIPWLRRADSMSLSPLLAERWGGEATDEERRLLENLPHPVIDVGCGPGRHLEALGTLGIPAMGVDTSPVAIGAARRRGGVALERSVFSKVPGEGRWGSALLLDGNVGIRGDPAGLLSRVAELVEPGGPILVEIGPPGASLWAGRARLERGGVHSEWFPWAEVGAASLGPVAHSVGLVVGPATSRRGRWFSLVSSR
jgi:glycosyltransferase A (GT-A) superfamily protein (DUF2064 family)